MNTDSPACVFQVLEGNVQEFVLKEASRRAVDEMFDLTAKNLRESASNNTLLGIPRPVLIDSSIGLQPINYALSKLRAVTNQFPGTRKQLIAIILPSSPLLKTLSMMMRPIATMRIYMPHERDQALAWLRKGVEAKL